MLIFFITLVFILYVCISFFVIAVNHYNKFENDVVIPVNPIGMSIIIIARNEDQNILHLLNDIQNQKYVGKFEVIVVDDGSEDKTAAIVANYKSNFALKLLLLNEHKKFDYNYKKQAQLIASQNAQYNYFLFLDADCIIPSFFFLNTYASQAGKANYNLIYGGVNLIKSKKWINAIDYMEWQALQALTKAFGIQGISIMCNAANMLVKKEFFAKHITWDSIAKSTTSGDDILLLQKLKQEPQTICYLNFSNTIVLTQPVNTFADYLSQRARWISKSKHYQFGVLSSISILIGLTNFIFSLIIIYFLLSFKLQILAIILIKCIIDYLFAKSFLLQPLPMVKFVISSLCYPFVIIIVIICSKLNFFTWKHRKIVY